MTSTFNYTLQAKLLAVPSITIKRFWSASSDFNYEVVRSELNWCLKKHELLFNVVADVKQVSKENPYSFDQGVYLQIFV